MVNTRKPRILITNDDGVNSANIHALARALSPIGEVFVFAPETEQSGVSQAFTIRKSLRVREHSVHDLAYRAFSVSGTPADSAKFALGHYAVRHFAVSAAASVASPVAAAASPASTAVASPAAISASPAATASPATVAFAASPTATAFAALDIHGNPTFDVCFSGINVGENSGVSSLYSGTVAGAREAALWGVPAVALSVSLGGESLMSAVLDFAKRIVAERLFESIPKGSFWNVNFPKSVDGSFKGYKVTKMALGMFTDHYDCTAGEACGSDSSWQLDGEKLWDEQPVDSDDYLLHQGYATITPHRIDQTDEKSFEKLSDKIKGKLAGGGSL